MPNLGWVGRLPSAMSWETLVVRLRREMAQQGYTQLGLAQKAKLHDTAVRDILVGRSKNPTRDTLNAINDALGLPEGTLAAEWARSTEWPPRSNQPSLIPGTEPVPANVRPGFAEAPAVGAWSRDLPVWGTAAGGSEWDDVFELNVGSIVDHIRRPPRLAGVPNVFAVFIAGDSMVPRYYDRDPVIVHRGVPVGPGEDVLVELHPKEEGGPHGGLVKRLVSKSSERVRLEQFNPPDKNIVVPQRRIIQVSRVVPLKELFF